MNGANLGAAIALSLLLAGVGLTARKTTSTLAPAKRGAVDFVVTSAADAGPGTLRDAIFAADRLTTRARIVLSVKRVSVESPLPAFVNPNGITIEADGGNGVIDAARQTKGPVLQINSPTSVVHGLSVINAHDVGVVVSAAAVELSSVSVSESKVGLFLSAAAKGSSITNASFEHNETGITAEAAIRDVVILGSTFRANSRAGFWFVGSAEKNQAEVPKESVKIVDCSFENNATGIILANRPTLIQKSRFAGSRESAILILGGAARVEDSEFRGSVGTAISVTNGKNVSLVHNTLLDNPATAISVRDSQITIERNTLQDNGFGIVAISSQNSDATVIRENSISKSHADALTVIGGSPQLTKNQMFDNHSAGLRVLDLTTGNMSVKGTPRLDGNVIHGNGIDVPATATYKLAGTLTPQ